MRVTSYIIRNTVAFSMMFVIYMDKSGESRSIMLTNMGESSVLILHAVKQFCC